LGTEIERKFLVDRREWQEVRSRNDYVDIEQTYLHAAEDRDCSDFCVNVMLHSS